MADTKSAEERSRNMAAIRSTNTAPELYIRKLLFNRGYRYRLYDKRLPGHPDLWMKKYNTAVYVNGCFWHRHNGCRYAYTPKSRLEFWNETFRHNVERDLLVKRELEERNIRCLVIWECTVKNAQKKNGNPDTLLQKITSFLNSSSNYAEI